MKFTDFIYIGSLRIQSLTARHRLIWLITSMEISHNLLYTCHLSPKDSNEGTFPRKKKKVCLYCKSSQSGLIFDSLLQSQAPFSAFFNSSRSALLILGAQPAWNTLCMNGCHVDRSASLIFHRLYVDNRYGTLDSAWHYLEINYNLQ